MRSRRRSKVGSAACSANRPSTRGPRRCNGSSAARSRSICLRIAPTSVARCPAPSRAPAHRDPPGKPGVPVSPTMTRTFWAPGRVNLIGEHTDYSGGLVLPVALDRGIRLTVEPTRGPMELTSADGDVGRYADAMLAELEVLGRPAVNLAGRIESDLPIGAGLSSSAALEVALGLALCAVAEFAIDPLVLAQVAQRAEHRATGVPCGVMDQAVSLLGREGHALLLNTGSLEWELVPLPPELRIVVIDSGVRRQLEHSGYAERRAELERGLAGAVDPVALRRVRHVHSENERVREVVEALRSDPVDLGRLGELFREGHAS